MIYLPKDVQEAIEINDSLHQLMNKSDYYEKLDWLEESEKLDRLYEYRSKLFSLLKRTQAIDSDPSFEPVRTRIENLLIEVLNWSEQTLVSLLGAIDIPLEEEYKEISEEYVVDNAFLFYKLPVSDDYNWFIDRWRWIVDNVTKNHLKADYKNNHTRLLSGNDYQISLEDVDYVVWKYAMEDVVNYLHENSSRFMLDKKEVESRKKWLISELKERYPTATWSCKTFLLSSKNWKALCEDFFQEEKESILNRIKESKVLENPRNATVLIVILSLFLNSYLESWILNKKFEDYIFMRAEEEFKKAEQKKFNISQQKESKPTIKNQTVTDDKIMHQKKDLPVWMEEEIKNLDIIDASQLIRFLKKELTNFWWHIKMSHLKDRLMRMSESEALPDVLALLDNYSEFTVEDDETASEEESIQIWNSDNTETIKSLNSEESLLNKLSEISNKSDIQERLSWYISMFEELWFQFKDKENFLQQLENAIDRTDKGCLEKSIQIALKFRIYGNESLSKKWAFWYRAICLNYRAWRIVLTNMQITHILPHDEYEKLINTKPSP